MKKAKNKIVYIEWLDALSKDGWVNEEEKEKWCKDKDVVMDVGFLLIKDKEITIIAQSISGATGHYGYLKKIPTKCIKKLKYLP